MDPQLIEFQKNLVRICNEIYREIGGYGPEALYQKALMHELIKSNFSYEYELAFEEPIRIYYKDIEMSSKRMDIAVYERPKVPPFVILELKWLSENTMEPYQLSNYMNMTGCKYGYMINFEKIGQHPVDFVAKVFDVETNQEITWPTIVPKKGKVTLQRFENPLVVLNRSIINQVCADKCINCGKAIKPDPSKPRCYNCWKISVGR